MSEHLEAYNLRSTADSHCLPALETDKGVKNEYSVAADSDPDVNCQTKAYMFVFYR